jgi:hypothetical protein
MALRGAVRDGTLIPESLIVAKEISDAADRCFGPHDEWSHFFSSYEGSLDATKALHDAVLKNHQWHISNEANGDGYVCSIFDNKRDRYTATTHQPCPARAWLLAILEALIAQEAKP